MGHRIRKCGFERRNVKIGSKTMVLKQNNTGINLTTLTLFVYSTKMISCSWEAALSELTWFEFSRLVIRSTFSARLARFLCKMFSTKRELLIERAVLRENGPRFKQNISFFQKYFQKLSRFLRFMFCSMNFPYPLLSIRLIAAQLPGHFTTSLIWRTARIRKCKKIFWGQKGTRGHFEDNISSLTTLIQVSVWNIHRLWGLFSAWHVCQNTSCHFTIKCHAFFSDGHVALIFKVENGWWVWQVQVGNRHFNFTREVEQ